jgi:hypothetical protein
MISTRSMGFDIGACLGFHLGPHGCAACPVELGAAPVGEVTAGLESDAVRQCQVVVGGVRHRDGVQAKAEGKADLQRDVREVDRALSAAVNIAMAMILPSWGSRRLAGIDIHDRHRGDGRATGAR